MSERVARRGGLFDVTAQLLDKLSARDITASHGETAALPPYVVIDVKPEMARGDQLAQVCVLANLAAEEALPDPNTRPYFMAIGEAAAKGYSDSMDRPRSAVVVSFKSDAHYKQFDGNALVAGLQKLRTMALVDWRESGKHIIHMVSTATGLAADALVNKLNAILDLIRSFHDRPICWKNFEVKEGKATISLGSFLGIRTHENAEQRAGSMGTPGG